jgi:hypothetical protein
MSLVKISGNASGTGTLTIAAPNTNTNYTLTLPTNTGTFLTNATTTGFPAGSVLQVLSTTKTNAFTTTSTSFTDVTGLSVAITPSSATSKILVTAAVQHSISVTNNNVWVQLVRDSTAIGNGTDGFGGSRADTTSLIWCSTISYLDSPATTSSTTYKIQLKAGAGTAAVNTRASDSAFLVSSHITVMEIAV